MSELSPGDLCVVRFRAKADGHRLGVLCAGRTVVLVSSYRLVDHPTLAYGTYWRVSGLPAGVIGLHECLLEKIPPAPMAEDADVACEAAK